ncbi:hypothetical protein ACOME3_009758 [Neoechinorhynchus agilis]
MLRSHVIEAHRDEFVRISTDSSGIHPKQKTCQMCLRVFDNRGELVAHENEHMGLTTQSSYPRVPVQQALYLSNIKREPYEETEENSDESTFYSTNDDISELESIDLTEGATILEIMSKRRLRNVIVDVEPVRQKYQGVGWEFSRFC